MPDYSAAGRARVSNANSGTSSSQGSRANESFASTADLDTGAWTAEHERTYPGASGIAGSRVRSTPEYKKSLKDFITKKQQEKTAKKVPTTTTTTTDSSQSEPLSTTGR
jgi:hypothetical protein